MSVLCPAALPGSTAGAARRMQRPARSVALPLRRIAPVCRRALRPVAAADPAVSSSSGQPAPSSSSSAHANGNGAAAAPPTAAMGLVNTVNENFTGDMLKPSVVNTPVVRAVAVLASVALVAGSTAFLPARLGAFLHVTSYAVLLGTQLWNTFFVGITMFKSLPRQTFGRVQSKMFPQYFALTSGANLLALGTLFLAGASSTGPGVRALVGLGVSLAAGLANWLLLEPVCTKLMFERYDIENLPQKTEADKERISALYKQFGKWHGISSLVNLVGFCAVVAHGWYLASLLVV